MKNIIVILLFFLSVNLTNGQKRLEIPENEDVKTFLANLSENLNKYKLDDLRKSTDSVSIRIWKPNKILTVTANSAIYYDYKIFVNYSNSEIKEKTYIGILPVPMLDILNSFDIWELHDESFRGIDGSFVFFEISTKTSYKICSFWSPEITRNSNNKNAVQTIDFFEKILKTDVLWSEFIENLPSGTYSLGMTNFRVDRFLDKNIKKTDFYSYAEENIKRELEITDSTSFLKYPQIIINDYPAQMADLNSYTKKNIVDFEIIKPNDLTLAIYGSNANHGLVKIKTKK